MSVRFSLKASHDFHLLSEGSEYKPAPPSQMLRKDDYTLVQMRDIHFLYGVMIFCVELHLELRDYIVEYSGRKKEHLMQLEVLWIRGQWRTWPQLSY